jgi:PilZ domain
LGQSAEELLTSNVERFKVRERLRRIVAVLRECKVLGESKLALRYDRDDEEFDGEESERKYLRAGVRVNSRVKVAVERKEGPAARAEGHTMDISAHGCMAIVPEEFEVGETLVVTNLINQKACDAVLVWRGHHATSGWELGLQLRDPGTDFWELEF